MPHVLYASTYGSTKQYAEELGRRLGVTPRLIDDTDPASLTGSAPVITLSYSHGPKVPAAEFLARHELGQRPLAACAVGMSLEEEVLKRDPLKDLLGKKAEQVQRFYLPGRLNYSELSSKHAKVMFGIVNALKLKPRKSDNDRAMIEAYNCDIDRVDFAKLDKVEEWLRGVDKRG